MQGSQQHPIRPYSSIDSSNHGVESRYPAMSAKAIPVAGCRTTADTVKIISAKTTSRLTAAMILASPDRCARTKKNAMPAPVPNSTVEDTHTNSYGGIGEPAGHVPPSKFRFEIR